MSPVFVGDVAAVMASMAREDKGAGQVVELVGPREYTYASLVEMFQDASMHQHHSIPVPKALLKYFILT